MREARETEYRESVHESAFDMLANFFFQIFTLFLELSLLSALNSTSYKKIVFSLQNREKIIHGQEKSLFFTTFVVFCGLQKVKRRQKQMIFDPERGVKWLRVIFIEKFAELKWKVEENKNFFQV